MRTRRGTVRLHGLGADWRGIPRPADRVEGGGPRRPRTSTTRCGSGSRPRRTPSSPPATPSAPSATPSSGRTPKPRRRCWPRPKRSTPPTWTRRARRCARSATSGTRSARCRANGAPSWSDGCAPSRRRCATRRSARRRSGSAGPGRPIPCSRRAIRAAGREGRGGGAHQGRRGGASQRRAVASVGRRGRRGARQAGLGFSDAVAVVVGVVGVVAEACPAGPLSGVRRHALRRSSSAASCSAVRAHTARAQLKASTITAIHAMTRPDARARVVRGRGLPRPHRQQPEKDATVDPASAIHASAHRRVSSASIEKPTPKTSASQLNTRDGNAMPLADRRVVAHQHVPAPGVAGVRQHERQQQHEHRDGDDQRPCAGVDFARDAAFGRLDVALERRRSRRCLTACGHRAHPVDAGCARGADAGHAEADARCGGRLPGRVGVAGPGAAVGRAGRRRRSGGAARRR